MKYRNDFSFGTFAGTSVFAVNALRYSPQYAKRLFKEFTTHVIGPAIGEYSMGDAWVRFRKGIDQNSKQIETWWIETKQMNGSIPVWEFHENR